MMPRRWIGWAVLLAPTVAALGQDPAPRVTVGSKQFTESVILGELLTQLGTSVGCQVTHRRELGGTQILWNALLRGDIDIYPEYTGTITQEILSGSNIVGMEALRAALAAQGVHLSKPLGFNDTYALGMSTATAERLQIRSISDLRAHPALKLGFSNEFMDRADGWRSLRTRYALPQEARGLDHDLAYRGLESASIDVTDLYSTDAEIRYYHLRVLQDDLGQFPAYDAVLVYRADLSTRAPRFVAAVQRLEGRISAADMVALNALAKLDKLPEARVASDFLATHLAIVTKASDRNVARSLLRWTVEHLQLVGASLAAALIVALPLGVIAAKRPVFGQVVLGAVGVVQTIPSLALLVFMIPLLGIGTPTAIVALFLYSLLPIIRNTYTGLRDISPQIHESAKALGLPPGARLWRVELPMASRSILAGIKTSAVINVGTATLGAIIGAGGFGQPILTGIRLDDVRLILLGAIPAAALALIVQGAFELLDRLLVPKGLRLREAGVGHA